MNLKAFYVDDMPTIFAAASIEEAKSMWEEIHGEDISDGYPYEVDAEELDAVRPDFNVDGEATGQMTTMRAWLEEASAGWLCGAE
ncbi:hypothetical protein PQS91_10415 [Stenotrophomonas geniculata]|uniref:hypothetical protein n=1 Tax=Stenotrophomonas geniculata TaxID=86188 RepID=UPI00234F4966|nr:hypothetical protein [Stenotrophomonas geniculata]MDC7800260.1 hypothetical protein [Stenotrophomonas geniculata]